MATILHDLLGQALVLGAAIFVAALFAVGIFFAVSLFLVPLIALRKDARRQETANGQNQTEE